MAPPPVGTHYLVGDVEAPAPAPAPPSYSSRADGGLSRGGGEARTVTGRWPTNVIVNAETAARVGEAGAYFPEVNSMRELGEWLGRLLAAPE